LPDGITVQGAGVEIDYGEGEFGVTFARMPFLSALLEFLVTSVGYGALDEAVAPLLGRVPTQEEVSDAANGLSRVVYDYLKQHLPSVQTQRKSRSLLTFLAEQSNGEVGPGTLDDQAVLDYWLSHSADDGNGIDAKTYQSVFQSAISLLRVLRFAVERYQMNGALPIGTDREAGEIDPAKIEEAVASIDETPNPLDVLKQPPVDAVKFLNGREMDALDGVVFGTGVANDLPVSVLRNAVFSRAQFRITNTLRKNPPAGEMLSFIETVLETDYPTQVARFQSLAEHLEKTVLASLYALVYGSRMEAISVILSVLPNSDLGDLMGDLVGALDKPDWEDSNVVSLHAESAASRFMKMLRQGEGLSPDLKDLMFRAKKAHKENSRQGFQDHELRSEETIDAFVIAVDALLVAEKELKSFLNHPVANVDWSRQFTNDEIIFKDQYRLLYGVGHD
jgi:hypothetical protein